MLQVGLVLCLVDSFGRLVGGCGVPVDMCWGMLR